MLGGGHRGRRLAIASSIGRHNRSYEGNKRSYWQQVDLDSLEFVFVLCCMCLVPPVADVKASGGWNDSRLDKGGVTRTPGCRVLKLVSPNVPPGCGILGVPPHPNVVL